MQREKNPSDISHSFTQLEDRIFDSDSFQGLTLLINKMCCMLLV